MNGVAPAGAGHRGAMWWTFPQPRPALSSGSVGGGLQAVSWVLNIAVAGDYRRTDLDRHAAEVASEVGLSGSGTALFTAADVNHHQYAALDEVEAWCTVGVTRPTWPADRAALATAGQRLPPGTVNTVVLVPVRLTASALVQAGLTAAEAKAQACVEAGVPGTGTCSDAVVVVAGADGPEESFAGVRSYWGARIAIAVHAVVSAGLRPGEPGRPKGLDG